MEPGYALTFLQMSEDSIYHFSVLLSSIFQTKFGKRNKMSNMQIEHVKFVGCLRQYGIKSVAFRNVLVVEHMGETGSGRP